jgi:hypothetical protein
MILIEILEFKPYALRAKACPYKKPNDTLQSI